MTVHYVTTAISFVNGAPHIGHALELIYADAIARAERKLGRDVRFQTGTDENSLKSVRAAEEAGITPQELVDRNAARFRALADRLKISYDDFVRTTEPRHVRGVHELWRACEARGDFYRAPYRGWYCVGCEQFYAPADLVEGSCPEHGVPPELVEETNVFFRLSRYEATLRELIESGRYEITPPKAREEIAAFLNRGLTDLSVSRSFARARGWGIAVPDDPQQIIYVWFDALANYITTLDPEHYARYWRDGDQRTHVVGKGITRFHAVYWPAFLLSAGLPLPTRLAVHGYLTADGKKIGKSLGNVIDPEGLLERVGLDPLRYYLLRHVRPTEDADISEERLVRARDAELADQLGNLIQRTAKLIERSCAGRVPAAASEGHTLLERAAALQGPIDTLRPDRTLASIFSVVEAANRYVEEQAPWRVADKAKLEAILGALAVSISRIGQALEPFLPDTASAIAARFIGGRVHDAPPLFPKGPRLC